MILAWGLATCALILFVLSAAYLASIAFKEHLPSVSAEVIDRKLVSKKTDNAQLVMFVVRYKIGASQEGTIKYLFPGGNVEAASNSPRFERLDAAYPRGAQIYLHYVPGLQAFGYIPESPVFRMETAMLLVGCVVSGLIITSAVYFLILNPIPM